MAPRVLRVIVTGSRTWTNWQFVWTKLDGVLEKADRRIVVVQGECTDGPDMYAKRWALVQEAKGYPVTLENHKADWSQGNGAGFRRSERMVRLGAWGVLGFVDDCRLHYCNRPRPHGSHGTSHCLKVAKYYKIPIKAWKTKDWKQG